MFLFFFRERKGKGGKKKSICGCLSHAPYWGPGPQARHAPFGSQAGTQSTEPHQPGLPFFFTHIIITTTFDLLIEFHFFISHN